MLLADWDAERVERGICGGLRGLAVDALKRMGERGARELATLVHNDSVRADEGRSGLFRVLCSVV